MALDLLDVVIGEHRLRVVASNRAEGDLHPKRVASDVLEQRQTVVAGNRWKMIDQVHGIAVVSIVSDQDAATNNRSWPLVGVGDVVVARSEPIGIWAADCAAVILFGSDGLTVGAHAGWRGLAAGVVDVAVAAVRDRGSSICQVVIGPMIHSCCYEFGAQELAAVAQGVHASVGSIAGVTADGAAALDVPRAVAQALAHHGLVADAVGPCTGCDPAWFSHRVRGDSGRHATVAWAEPAVESSAGV